MSRPILGACALAVVISLAPAFVAQAAATTAPGFVFTVQAVMSDSRVVLLRPKNLASNVPDTYIRAGGSSAQFPRGVFVRFVFVNKGTRSYLPAIRITDKSQSDPHIPVKNLYVATAIRPGGRVSLLSNFYFRGSFRIEELVNNKAHGGSVQVSIY